MNCVSDKVPRLLVGIDDHEHINIKFMVAKIQQNRCQVHIKFLLHISMHTKKRKKTNLNMELAQERNSNTTLGVSWCHQSSEACTLGQAQVIITI